MLGSWIRFGWSVTASGVRPSSQIKMQHRLSELPEGAAGHLESLESLTPRLVLLGTCLLEWQKSPVLGIV